MRRSSLLLAALFTPTAYSVAADGGAQVQLNISPVFGQLVSFASPKGFTPVFENTQGQRYISEAVPAGENVNKWTQMLTITGLKDLVANPNVTPRVVIDQLADAYSKNCPSSFTGTSVGALKFGNHDAFGAVVSCGIGSGSATPAYSEAMLVIAIKGNKDYYTIQWAERGAASPTPVKYDDAKWRARYQQLQPIKLCPILPGEKTPYPSCTGGK